MDFARRFVNSDNEWNNRSLAQLSLQYSYSDLYAATDGFHEKNKIGSGSYGQIFKGLMNDGTEVAIKVIDLPAEAGFEDEVWLFAPTFHLHPLYHVGSGIVQVPTPQSCYSDGICLQRHAAVAGIRVSLWR